MTRRTLLAALTGATAAKPKELNTTSLREALHIFTEDAKRETPLYTEPFPSELAVMIEPFTGPDYADPCRWYPGQVFMVDDVGEFCDVLDAKVVIP